MSAAGSPAAPQLQVRNMNPFDDDIPFAPPIFALLSAVVVVPPLILWKGRRAVIAGAHLPKMHRYFRALIVLAVGALTAWFMTLSGSALADADSGITFTPVGGIAATGPYRFVRHPLYVFMMVVMCPAVGVLFDSVWFWTIWWPVQIAYLHFVVMPMEEGFLLANYPTQYGAYMDKVSRYGVVNDTLGYAVGPLLMMCALVFGLMQDITWRSTKVISANELMNAIQATAKKAK